MAIPTLLTIGLATQNIPNAIGKGVDLTEARQQRRDEALRRKQEGDLKLQVLQHQVDTLPTQDQILQQKLQMQEQQLHDMKMKAIQHDTFTALNNFFDSAGDPRSLNQFLQDYKDDPAVQTAFNGAVKVEPINYKSPEDQDLLKQAGLSQEELDAADGTKDGQIDWDKLNARYTKVITKDGETRLVDMLHIAAATGYNRYVSDQQIEKLIKLAQLQKAQQGPAPTSLERNAQAYGEAKKRIEAGTASEADKALVRKFEAESRGPAEPAPIRTAKEVAAAKARIEAGNPQPGDAEIVKFGAKELGGVDAGKESLVTQARTQWQAKEFDNLSQKELQKNPEARQLVNQIELAHPISAPMQKELTDLNAMIALSKEAGQLSETQTGLLDSVTSNAASYVNNSVKDKTAKSAYMALINQFRHNLFGSALTTGELQAFAKAYATDKQKIGPVLSGLRSALIQIKSKLQTISDLNDPAVIKFRTGKSVEDIQKALQGVEERISYYNKIEAGMTPEEAAQEVKLSKQTVPKTKEDIAKALGL